MENPKIGSVVIYTFEDEESPLPVSVPAFISGLNGDNVNLIVFISTKSGSRLDQLNVPYSELPQVGCYSLVQ